MKTFNLDEALKGAKLCTRSGKPARLICSDRVDTKYGGSMLALVINNDKTFERIVQYDKTGRQLNFVSDLDLMIDDGK